jgi:AsmA-like protein
MKWLLAAVGAIVGLTIAAVVALPRVVETARVHSLIASSVTQALARPVRFRSASLSVLPYPSVHLRGVEIGEDPAFGAAPFARLDDAYFRLRLWPLLRGHLEFATVVLERPTVTLVHGSGGRWNFASLGATRESAPSPRVPRTISGGTPAALVSRVVIERGTVVYERRGGGGIALLHRLEDVDVTLSPRPGALSFTGSARVVPGGLSVRVSEGTIGFGGARTLADASLRARMEIDGDDVRALAAVALGGEPAIGGALTGRLDVSGSIGRPRAVGEVEWRDATLTRTSATCAEPRRRTLALAPVRASVSWRDGRLIAEPLTGGIPGGTATARLTAMTLPPLRAELSDLVVERVPIERVLVDFLCQDYAVAGPVDLTATLALSPDDPLRTLSGRGRLHVGAGHVVGARALSLLGGLARVGSSVSVTLGADLPATLAISPLEFDSIAGSFEITGGVVTTRDLLYTGRALTVRARGDLALASGQVNADVVLERDRRVFEAKVTGPADSPSIRTTPTVAGVDRSFKDLLKKFR